MSPHRVGVVITVHLDGKLQSSPQHIIGRPVRNSPFDCCVSQTPPQTEDKKKKKEIYFFLLTPLVLDTTAQ